MSETTTTPFSSKCEILSDLWVAHRTEEAFQELFSYADLAFPLAFAISMNMVKSTEAAEADIEEAWNLLMGQLEIDDTNVVFEYLEDVFQYASLEL
jgi:hypothetical protein